MDPFEQIYESVYFPEEIKKFKMQENQEKIDVTKLYQRETFENSWNLKNTLFLILFLCLFLLLLYSF
jgi:hypothetical protein